MGAGAFDARWQQEAAAMLAGFKEWRRQHPRASLSEIEAALDARWAMARARLLQDAALNGAAAALAVPDAPRPQCPTEGARRGDMPAAAGGPREDHAVAESFGRRLRELRARAGFTQARLALAVGVTPSMVQRWERRGVLPQADRLPVLAAALGVAPATLLGLAPEGHATAGCGARGATRPPSLRALREAAGLSQWQLAVRLGVTEGAISRWEAGGRVPGGRHLAGLAALLAHGAVDTVLASLEARRRP